jgi:hypothetical protein
MLATPCAALWKFCAIPMLALVKTGLPPIMKFFEKFVHTTREHGLEKGQPATV